MTSIPLSDLFGKALAVLNTRSGRTLLAAMALAGAITLIILYAPIRAGEVFLAPIRRDIGRWIFIMTVFCGSLAVVLRLMYRYERRITRRALKEAEALILAHLDTLPCDEKDILRRCVLQGHSSFSTQSIGGYSIVRDEALNRLAKKDLIKFSSWDALPYSIPLFVWEELQKRLKISS